MVFFRFRAISGSQFSYSAFSYCVSWVYGVCLGQRPHFSHAFWPGNLQASDSCGSSSLRAVDHLRSRDELLAGIAFLAVVRARIGGDHRGPAGGVSRGTLGSEADLLDHGSVLHGRELLFGLRHRPRPPPLLPDGGRGTDADDEALGFLRRAVAKLPAQAAQERPRLAAGSRGGGRGRPRSQRLGVQPLRRALQCIDDGRHDHGPGCGNVAGQLRQPHSRRPGLLELPGDLPLRVMRGIPIPQAAAAGEPDTAAIRRLDTACSLAFGITRKVRVAILV